MHFLPPDPPPVEDSPDFTDEEAQHAILTTSESDLAKKVVVEISPGHASVGKSDARYAASGKWKILRKGDNLYARTHLVCPNEADKVLVYQINWLATQGQSHESKQ